jgi:hypothetical protein
MLHRFNLESVAARTTKERTLHGQADGDTGVVKLHGDYRFGLVADAECLALDGAEQVEDPPILEPHVIVEEAAELVGEETNGGLGALAGVDPVEMDPAQSPVLTAEILDLLESLE